MIRIISENELRRRSIEYIKFPYRIDDIFDNNIKIRTYELKIDRSHLNKDTENQLDKMFLEEKWFCNYVISQDDIFKVDYKINKIPVKVKNVYEEREIKYLSSQMKQETINRLKDNIVGLSEAKEKGIKIGRLKYKSKLRSIPLIQYGNTYRILDYKYVKIQCIDKKIRVNGLWQILDQIEDGIEIGSANLIKKHGDFYIHITTYIKKKEEEKKLKPIRHVGLDFGIARQIVLSNGIKIEYKVPINKKLRKIHRELSRQERFGKNWNKTKIRLNKKYNKLNNIKKDIKVKIVHRFKDKYPIVCYQDENIKAWQRIWGKTIIETSIGGIISTLKTKVRTPIEVDRFFPSTKRCSKCGNKKDIGLNERIYVCDIKECGNIMDRDLNSSDNILDEGLKSVGTVRIELTPEEILTSTLNDLEYFNNIPYVRANLVNDTGSFTT